MVDVISIDTHDPTPPFEQIRAALADEIRSGRLAAGHRLPTVRQLAGDLRVAPGTVGRAYRALEQAGLVSTHRSQGTIVRDGQAMRLDLELVAQDLVEKLRHHDTQLEDVVHAITTAWNRR
ncbi:MAG: GntR family transcriptional regulator [Microcella sp.]